MSTTPIADHALLSDRHSSALVDTAGSVEWLSFPRFDSPSVFGRLLGPAAGHWQIQPAGKWSSSRRYLDRSLVLETTFTTDTGSLVLTDLLAMGPHNHGHELGRDAPHLLVRRLMCAHGQVDVEVSYEPRPEYGLVVPLLAAVEGGVTARGGAEWLVLTTPMLLSLGDGSGNGRLSMREGETLHLALHRTTLEQIPARVWSQAELAEQVDNTLDAWGSWSDLHETYTGPWRDLVHHSGRVLQGLSFQPSGAIVAAPTTSLPESVGGARNWDYRYCWVRDSSFTMDALWVAACPDEAANFFAFMTTAAASGIGPGQGLQPMFGVGGERDLAERELPHLPGWRESSPVRVGNGAWNQRQIDVYGEILGAAERLADHISDIDDDTRRFLVACADAAAEHWLEKDRGIWEVRGAPQHFVFSKVMCWFALDRAILLADRLGARERVDRWTRTRDQIHESVVRDGWSDQAGAFTQYFGSTDLDASNLMMAIVGFLPADEPRMLSTIEAIETRLTDAHGLVYRYRTERGVDGLTGGEGTFLVCTFWLAQAMALSGQLDRAQAVFQRAVAFVNDVGLLAEGVHPETGEMLGNFPQAFSHIGLVNAAWAISEAERKRG